MNKTLTINLSGRIFHVDEDAYKLLYDYLYNLKHAFEHTEGGNEIIDDLEGRLAELLIGYTAERTEVVSVATVEKVIAMLGKPEEITGEENNLKPETDKKEAEKGQPINFSDKQSDNTEQTQEDNTPPHTHTTRKRLFRNPDNRLLGGVLGGLAIYLNWDPTLLRLLLFVILIAGYGTVIPIYLICWIIIPKAITATDKLNMKGEPITMENIGKIVTSGMNNASEYLRSDKPRTTLQKLADGFVSFRGILFKISLLILAICCSPFLFVLLILFVVLVIALGALLIGGTAALGSIFPHLMSMNMPPTGISIACYVFAILAFILILGCFISGMLTTVFKWKGFSPRAMKIILIIALVSFIIAAVCGILSGFHLLPFEVLFLPDYINH